MNGISRASSDYQPWLKQIPVAKNNAPTDSFRVTQEGTQSSARTDVFENSGTAYTDFRPQTLTLGGWDDETFTTEDALMAQFNYRNRISLEDVMTGNIKNLKLGERLDEVEELRKKFQTEGLEKEIDWGKVESDLMGLSFEKNTCIDSNEIKLISIDKDELYKKIDYVASRYTVLKKRIEENFSGDELKEQLTMLDTVTNEKKN